MWLSQIRSSWPSRQPAVGHIREEELALRIELRLVAVHCKGLLKQDRRPPLPSEAGHHGVRLTTSCTRR